MPQQARPMVVQQVACTLEELYNGATKTATANNKRFTLKIQVRSATPCAPCQAGAASDRGPCSRAPAPRCALCLSWRRSPLPSRPPLLDPAPRQAGWKAGTKLSFNEDGVAFEVAEKEHSEFARQGNDLVWVATPGEPTPPVSPRGAALLPVRGAEGCAVSAGRSATGRRRSYTRCVIVDPSVEYLTPQLSISRCGHRPYDPRAPRRSSATPSSFV